MNDVAVLRHEVEGVFTVMRSDPNPKRPSCMCCEGEHVFAYDVDLPGEPMEPGARGPRPAHPEEWLRNKLYPLRERLDGATVRITVEIIEED